MRYAILLTLLILTLPLQAKKSPYYNLNDFDQGLFKKIEKITLGTLKNAFNPTMIAYEENILVAFRHIPDMKEPWINYIGIVLLNWDFEPITKPTLLDLRKHTPKIPSRAEDPRLIHHDGHIYLFYNDNLENTKGHPGSRREMYMAEIIPQDNTFTAQKPLLLKHPTNYPQNLQEKNWTPFSTPHGLQIAYTLNPHEILTPNLTSGHCTHTHTTSFDQNTPFPWAHLRGGTTPLLIDNEYLAFFHAFTTCYSTASKYQKTYHYFMGAYTFSSTPPYEITSMSPHPLMTHNLFTHSSYNKRVSYPGGFLYDTDNIYLIYGKDDCEIWMATLDRKKLMNTLQPVNSGCGVD